MSAKKIICFLVLLLSAGAYQGNVTKEQVVPLSSSNQFRIVLHSDREKYSIGESVRLKLQMVNSGTEPVTISGFVFDWTRLAFSSPHASHLLDPRGTDLLRPFYQPSPVAGSPSITVPGGGEEWLYLPITSHVRLQEPGNYSFWIELGDASGNLHKSNRINFSLEDVEYSVAPDLVDLSLRFLKPVWSPGERIEVEAVLHNKTNQPLIFLKPQDASFDGWVNPVYLFSVIDSEGRGLALAQPCGSMTTPIYDDDTTFRVQPGELFTQKLPLPVFPEMQKAGEYRVRLTYIVRNKAIGKAGEVLDKPMHWEPEVFIGRIVSSELTLTIK